MKALLASTALLLLVLTASPALPAAQATVGCTQNPANGIFPFGAFTIAFDLAEGVACLTYCTLPGDVQTETLEVTEWGTNSYAGLNVFHATGPSLEWEAAYDGGTFLYGTDPLWGMEAAAGVPNPC
jgi:hypothetical protein